MPKPDDKSRAKPGSPITHAATPWVSEEALERAVGVAAARGEAGTPHVLFVMHVERLDDIARGCGRDAESAVLDLIALVLSNLTGDGIPFCRLDKDRIAVIKSGCPLSRAPAVARQIHASLEGGVFKWRGRQFRLRASVGAVLLRTAPEGAAGLIQRARDASVAAQELGDQGCILLDGTPGETARLKKEREWFEHLSETIV